MKLKKCSDKIDNQLERIIAKNKAELQILGSWKWSSYKGQVKEDGASPITWWNCGVLGIEWRNWENKDFLNNIFCRDIVIVMWYNFMRSSY